MDEVRVVIPEERYQLFKFEMEGLPGVGCANAALLGFEPKVVFQWHLSIVLHFKGPTTNGMPSSAEVARVDGFGDTLDALLKGTDSAAPNALFLSRTTWNGTRELMYRVHDPKVANGQLQGIIQSGEHPCGFEFRMEADAEWKLAEGPLSVVEHG